MTPLKNARRERFCQELAKGQPQRRAYIDAGYKTVKNDATDAAAAKLAAVPEVRDRIRELQQTSAKDVGVTVDSLLQEAERARQLAEDAKQPSAMVAATTLKAKISGLMVDRTEDLVRRDELEEQRVRRKATLAAISAGEMLAQAAESLGLLVNATAEDIALAASKCRYPPPEVQRLLFAARLREEKSDVPSATRDR